jgi:hypothetical protein
MKAIFAPHLTDVPESQHRLVHALCDLMSSPYSWDVLHANWGADGETAYRAAVGGMRAVIELAQRDPEALSSGEFPAPPKKKRRSR